MSPRPLAKSILPITAVSILLLVIAVGSAWYIRNMQKLSAKMLEVNLTSMRAAQELEFSVRELRTHGVRFLITQDPKQLEPIPRLKERIMTALENAEALAYTKPEQALTKRIRLGLKSFFSEYENMTNGNPKQAEYYRTLELVDSTLAEEVIEPTQEYLRLNEGMLVRANTDNQAVADRITTGLLALGLCGAGGGMLAGWVIAIAHRRSSLQAEARLRTTARQLDDAARSAEDAAVRGGRAIDALDDVAESAAAVLTRLKKTEREALRAEQLAWVGQMAAGIAHEVRNPLMAIKLLIQAAADGRQGERLRSRDFRVLEEEIVRLESIISSFLDFARPPKPVKSAVAIGPLVEEVADGVRGQAELRDVQVHVSRSTDSPIIQADANQVRQVLYNLLINAFDAQPTGGQVDIVISAESGSDAHGPSVVIQVEDHGTGLTSELQDQIFDPFVSTKESGMGLGLSICRRIVEDHEGTIRASNRPGGGAVFSIRLPLRQYEVPSRLKPSVVSVSA